MLNYGGLLHCAFIYLFVSSRFVFAAPILYFFRNFLELVFIETDTDELSAMWYVLVLMMRWAETIEWTTVGTLHKYFSNSTHIIHDPLQLSVRFVRLFFLFVYLFGGVGCRCI